MPPSTLILGAPSRPMDGFFRAKYLVLPEEEYNYLILLLKIRF
jgi:hypothetical protein